MIPRIVVRDSEDAIYLCMAIRTHTHAIIEELERKSRVPGADQYALSLETITVTEHGIELMRIIADTVTDLPDCDTIGDSSTDTESKDY
jgi:hypothetical protein